jgi:nitroreductase
MNEQFPDVETIRTALALATRAPSVHNSQPWRWRVADESLDLYADPTRHLSQTDPDRRDLTVSCGASLQHAVVALAALGWQSRVTRLPDPADRDHLASIRVSRCEPSATDISLAAAIPRRRTDRRVFSPWPVPRSDIAAIGTRVAHMGVQLRRVEMSIDIRAIVAQAVSRHVHDDAYLRELTTWSGRYNSTAGVPAHSTPKPSVATPLPARIFAGSALTQPQGAVAGDDHAVLLALGTSADDDLARLRAGEATSMALLTCTSLGLSSCPVTEPLEIAQTRAAIQSEVFGGAEYPQMMLRIGWAPVGADPLPATPRRPLDDVVSFPDGTPPAQTHV